MLFWAVFPACPNPSNVIICLLPLWNAKLIHKGITDSENTLFFCIDKTLNHQTGFILFHRIKRRVTVRLGEAGAEPSRVLKQLH